MSEHPAPTNPEVQFEKGDVDATSLLKFLFWTVVATVAIVFLLWRLYFVFVAREAARQPPPPVMRPDAAQMAPPRPLLQVQPEPPAELGARFAAQNLAEFRAQEDALLGSYGWVDKDLGRVRIPLAEEMRLVAERGLPSFLPTPPPAPAPTAPPGKGAAK